MQRLDHEYQMRTSRGAAAQAAAERVMREMFYTSQPMEKTNLKLLQAIRWNPSTPIRSCFRRRTGRTGTSTRRAFDHHAAVPEPSGAKRNILGLNAARVSISQVERKRPEGGRGAGGAAGRVLMAVTAHPQTASLGDDFVAAAERASDVRVSLRQVSDADLERVLTAAVRLYAAKVDADMAPAQPITPSGGDADRYRRDGERHDQSGRSHLWDVSMWFQQKQA